MGSVSGGLSDKFGLSPGVQARVPFPYDSTMLDSVLLYNYSPYLCVVTAGLNQGWLGPWSMDRFTIGDTATLTVMPDPAGAGSESLGAFSAAHLVAAFITREDAPGHLGAYPVSLTSPDQQARSLLDQQAAGQMHAPPAPPSQPPASPVLPLPVPPGAVVSAVYVLANRTKTFDTTAFHGWTIGDDYLYQGANGGGARWLGLTFYPLDQLSALFSKTLLRTEVFMYRVDQGWGPAGDTRISLGTHAYNPANIVYGGPFPAANYGDLTVIGSQSKGDAGWWFIPNRYGQDLINGNARGLILDSPDGSQSGAWEGVAEYTSTAVLRFTVY